MDQVSPLRVIKLDDTWDKKCNHGLVYDFQTGACSEKKIGSTKLCFCQRGMKSKISFIFYVIGKGIKDYEKQSYEDDVLFS